MKTALIGYTGFVGSNLNKQYDFKDLYNSSNINDIQGKEYDLVVCAGVKAVKWWANNNPEEDLEGIEDLISNLRNLKSKKFILISTVDVYQNPYEVDEDFDFNSIDQNKYHAYGKNRLYLENFVKNNFEDHHIIRLPGLFGESLKKNVIFDLLENNQTDKIIPNCKFQYYYLKSLWKDIKIVIDNDIKEINLNSEPIETSEIIRIFFPNSKVGDNIENPVIYDYRTKYFDLFGGENGYIKNKKDLIEDLKEFISNYKKGN